jgi:hypothetical protein
MDPQDASPHQAGPDTSQTKDATAVLDDAARIRELLAEAAAAPLPQDTGLTEQRAAEMMAEIQAGRVSGLPWPGAEI